MAIRKILQLGDPALREVAKPVREEFEKRYRVASPYAVESAN